MSTTAGTNDRGDDQGGLPATGRRFQVPGASIGRLRGGKIIEQRDYWNMTAFLMQVGLISAPQWSAEPARWSISAGGVLTGEA